MDLIWDPREVNLFISGMIVLIKVVGFGLYKDYMCVYIIRMHTHTHTHTHISEREITSLAVSTDDGVHLELIKEIVYKSCKGS